MCVCVCVWVRIYRKLVLSILLHMSAVVFPVEVYYIGHHKILTYLLIVSCSLLHKIDFEQKICIIIDKMGLDTIRATTFLIIKRYTTTKTHVKSHLGVIYACYLYITTDQYSHQVRIIYLNHDLKYKDICKYILIRDLNVWIYYTNHFSTILWYIILITELVKVFATSINQA